MFGVSDHDLMFTKEAETISEDGHEHDPNYIESRVSQRNP